jgi:hypothetical protein
MVQHLLRLLHTLGSEAARDKFTAGDTLTSSISVSSMMSSSLCLTNKALDHEALWGLSVQIQGQLNAAADLP